MSGGHSCVLHVFGFRPFSAMQDALRNGENPTFVFEGHGQSNY